MRPCVGQIDHSLGWSAKAFILGVRCNADHFNPPRRNVLKIAESPSKWVVIAEERACQGFAHNGDRRRRGLEVARLEVAAFQKWCSHRMEEIRGGVKENASGQILHIRWNALKPKSAVPVRSIKHATGRETNGFDAGNGGYAAA